MFNIEYAEEFSPPVKKIMNEVAPNDANANFIYVVTFA